jgi:predicted GIY-YIG superfamily endonuclease
MKPQQLRLFEPTQPLVDRFGPAFFRHLPRVPGVYWFADADGRLLYVGKARDLRRRLGSYRQVEGQAPKTARMVQRTTFIRWESCPTEAAALEREAELIRVYQPPFNRAGKWTGGRKWVWLEREGNELVLRLEDHAPDESSTQSGTRAGQPFVHSAPAAFASAVRLVLLLTDPGRTALQLPRQLLNAPWPRSWRVPIETIAGWEEPLTRFVEGAPGILLEAFEAMTRRAAEPFDIAFLISDFQRLCEATGAEPETQTQPASPNRDL